VKDVFKRLIKYEKSCVSMDRAIKLQLSQESPSKQQTNCPLSINMLAVRAEPMSKASPR
jgi:hypothetical protein